MKRILLTLVAIVSATFGIQAAPFITENFSYSDGSLTNVSSLTWFTHSGGAAGGQVQVAGGQIVLGGANTEDDSRSFPPANATTTGTLYASFTLNQTNLPPSTTPAYFFHFRDTGTSNFKCRVFIQTNGTVAPSTYRLGVAVGGNTANYIPTDLATNVSHQVVVRYNLDTTNATIWVDPSSEFSPVNTTNISEVGLGTGATVVITNVCIREVNSTAGAGTALIDNILVGTAFTDVATPTGQPSIGGIPDQSIPASSSTGAIPLTVFDVETPGNLTLSGTSDATGIIPNGNITFSVPNPSGASGRTVTVNSGSAQGTAHISVVVTDGDGLKNTNTFTVTVGAPSITSIANQAIPTNTSTAVLPFTVSDHETAAGSLTVTATSSNHGLIQDADVHLTHVSGGSWTVYVTPQTGQNGFSTITLTVNDGTFNVSTTFKVSVFQVLGVILADDFPYANGITPVVSSAYWVAHSAGLSNDSLVFNNKLTVSGTNDEDINTQFTNSGGQFFLAADSGSVLYSKFTVNFDTLPRASGGDYFAHYKDAGSSNFRARIFAETNFSASGKFRLGVANGAFTVADFRRDLNLGTTYTVVTRYDLASAATTLWINPHYETSPSISASDIASSIEIDAYCFRQGGGLPNPTSTTASSGHMVVDDVVVGTAFTDVVPFAAPPSPISLSISVSGGLATLTWANAAFTLESAPALTGPWTILWDATSGFQAPVSGTTFYRLVFQ